MLAISACAGTTGAEASGTEVGGVAFVPQHQDTVRAARFILVGDTGTGDDRARGVATQIRHQAEAVPVSHVFLLGDNLYEFRGPQSIANRFLDLYRDVLLLGVRIHAALGNHDLDYCTDSGLRPVGRDGSAYQLSAGCSVGSQLARPEFGYLDGFRYYSVEIPGGPPNRRGDAGGRPDSGRSEGPPLVEVFVLDTNTLGSEQTKLRDGSDEPQLRWLAEALQRSNARWKVVAMHHPIYAPTRCQWFGLRCRNEDEALQAELEPIFLEHGVDVVFQAHQHLYARLRPQSGIRYFVTGGGGRKTDSFREDERTFPRDDRGSFNHSVYVSASEDRFAYCVIDSSGDIRDGGTFGRGDAADRQVDPCSAQALDPASARSLPARQVGSALPSVTRMRLSSPQLPEGLAPLLALTLSVGLFVPEMSLHVASQPGRVTPLRRGGRGERRRVAVRPSQEVREILRDPPPAIQAAADAVGQGDATRLDVLFSRAIPGTEAWRR